MDIGALLDQSEFFRAASAASKKAITAICIPRVLSRRETLFMQGDAGHSMFLLALGSLQLFKTSADGKEVVIKLLRPAEIFGETILFEQDRYPVSARALTAAQVYLMPRKQFHCLLVEEGFRNDFIAMLLSKQRYLAEQIFRLSALDVEQRFFHFLRDSFGEREEYRIDISKRDVAAAIDALPETLSRLLLKLRDEGTVQWDGEILTVRKGFWRLRESF
jgi:CRP-like cAMP-binding protein